MLFELIRIEGSVCCLKKKYENKPQTKFFKNFIQVYSVFRSDSLQTPPLNSFKCASKGGNVNFATVRDPFLINLCQVVNFPVVVAVWERAAADNVCV